MNRPRASIPRQINETRDLIKGLAGDHTIILSTHILPEVEQTCEQVLIINKGKLVATDSVRNLQARARDAESLLLEVAARDGQPDALLVQQKLEAIPGVSRVLCSDRKDAGWSLKCRARRDSWCEETWRAPSSHQAGTYVNFVRPPEAWRRSSSSSPGPSLLPKLK